MFSGYVYIYILKSPQKHFIIANKIKYHIVDHIPQHTLIHRNNIVGMTTGTSNSKLQRITTKYWSENDFEIMRNE